MSRWVGCVGFVLVALGSLAPARAQPKTQPGFTLDLVKESPKSAFVKPTLAQPSVQAKSIIVDNVRAVAVLHAAWRLEKAGLFVAGDRLLADASTKKLTSELQKLVKVQKAAPGSTERAQFLKFVSELIHEQFAAIVDASKDQMKAYSELVASVASSLDEFTKDNVSDAEERDSLQTIATGLSNSGYGAMHFAAARISEHIHELSHVVQQSSVQKAYGAKDEWDLIAKLSGRSRGTVVSEVGVANAGTELLLWLRHAADPKLKVRAKKDNMDAVVERLKKLGVYVALAKKANPVLPKPRPLCLPPGSTTPKPCVSLASNP